MTHPADRVYRFDRLDHWARGLARGLVFTPAGDLATPSSPVARQVATAPVGQTIGLLASDPCGGLLWLDDGGAVWTLNNGLPAAIATVPRGLAARATRLVWGQEIAWIVAGDDVVRLDARSGNSMGSFAEAGWRVIDAAAARCDGVTVAEVSTREGARLREIRPEGRSRPLVAIEGAHQIVALAQAGAEGPIQVVDIQPEGWRIITLSGDGATSAMSFPGKDTPTPGRMIAADAAGRLVFGRAPRQTFVAAFGLLGPLQEIARCPGMGSLTDLIWAGGVLYGATDRGIFALEPDDDAAPPLEATYITPPLHSPTDVRSGWLRADLFTALPPGAQVTVSSRGFADPSAFAEALRGDLEGPLVNEGWNDARASVHFGIGVRAPLRHYLGDETAEHVALRFAISLPACSAPVTLDRLEVLYPNRSLIEQMPAIYRTGDSSEAQLRRMLAPFQALADEIDDLIGEGIRRVDPARADDLWTGMLLGWLGHGAFSRLPAALRRRLLQAMPEGLARRGTLEGFARVMAALAPGGFSIEDSARRPGAWVLAQRDDPAGARLGRETLAGPGAASGLTLGCDPLGEVPIGWRRENPALAVARCGAEITVRLFGGATVRESLEPYLDRIRRAFVPAHARVAFVFGDHRPAEALGHGRQAGPEPDPDSLITLDPGLDRRTSVWRLPKRGSRIVPQDTTTLDSAVLDGTLVLA